MKVLFVTYQTISNTSARCRSYFPRKAIELAGHRAKVKLIYFLTKRDIDDAGIVIFQRIPQAIWNLKRGWLPYRWLENRILNLFEYARAQKPTGYDLDDYIFFSDDEIKTGVSPALQETLLKQSHFVIASTPELAKELSRFNSQAVCISNAVDIGEYEKTHSTSRLQRLIRQISKWKQSGKTIVGWSCGKTHDQDATIMRQIIEGNRNSDLAFVLIGQFTHSEKGTGLVSYSKQDLSPFCSSPVLTTGMLHWKEVIQLLKQLDINLVILENSKLNRCKSELKLIEAGIFGIPSVCSRIGVYNEIVKEGENGLLAGNVDEWLVKIGQLAIDETLRKKIGAKVKETVRSEYSLQKRGGDYAGLFESLK